MTRCILHFGMPKTGSTSIQESLYSGLTDPDFYYADLGHPNHGEILVNAFQDRPQMYHTNQKQGISLEKLLAQRPAALQRLADQVGRCQARTMILSAEDACFFPKPANAAVLAFFSSLQCDLQCVAYVRSMRGGLESHFAQTLREPSLFSPVDVMQWLARKQRIRQFLEAKDAVFGREHVTLWPFSPAQFPQGCVVQDFCRRIGMKTLPRVIHRSNERLAMPAIRFLYAYRTAGQGYGVGPSVMHENAQLLRHLEKLKGPSFHFHSELLDDYCRRNEANIAWIESRLGASLREGMGQDKDEHAIRAEADLLAFSAESLEWLAERTGTAFRKLAHGDPSEVAAALHLLRSRPVKEEAREQSTISSVSFAGKMRQRARGMLSLARRSFRRWRTKHVPNDSPDSEGPCGHGR